MMKTRFVELKFWMLAVSSLLMLGTALSGRAAWIGSEGDEWLKWDANTRSTYLRAYVQGLRQGIFQRM